MRAIGPALVLFLAGCVVQHSAPSPAAPVEVRAVTAAAPRLVIRRAARELTAAGFVVTAIDSSSALRAEREHPPGEFEGTLTCRTGDTPDRAASIAPTMIIDLSVEPRDAGSQLVVASHVNAAYLRLSAEPARPADSTDCRSTGVIERRLAERLTASP